MKGFIKLTKKFPSVLSHIFFRTKFIEYNFYAGMTTFYECISIIFSVVKREPLVNGEYISRYEKAFAKYLGLKYAYTFATGRMGLYVILKALGLKNGDEIIIPGFTCAVVPNAILYAGLKPVYVDIDPITFNIDTSKIEERITPKTKVLYAQHTFGLMCEVEKIVELGKKYKIPVIEDCCLALGAERNGKKAGTFGDVAYFSTDHSKVISTSSGGMVVTNNEEVSERIKSIYLKTPFCEKKTVLKMLFTLISEEIFRHPYIYFWGKYVMELLGRFKLLYFFTDYERIEKPTKYPFPARLSNLQAKIGLHQLIMLEKIITHHRYVAEEYDRFFNLYNGYLKPNVKEHIFLRYVFLVKNPNLWKKKLKKYIEIESWFDNVINGRYKNFHEVNYQLGNCHIAEKICKHTINLPTHLKVRNPQWIIGMCQNVINIGNGESQLIKVNKDISDAGEK